MLLYVDKKKQRKRKIKIICYTLLFFFIIIANIIHFQAALHTTSQQLTDYQKEHIFHTWYDRADTVTIFATKKQTPKIIIIPQTINRENTWTIALAFSKLPHSISSLTFTQEIPEQDFLQKLANIFIQSSPDSSEKILITTQTKDITEIIHSQHLYPTTLNFQHTKKLHNIPELMNLINNKFPQPSIPAEPIKQEQLALKNFLEKYAPTIKKFLATQQPVPFIEQTHLLQNAKICLSTTDNAFFCNHEKNKSIQHNIKQILKQIPPKKTIATLFLLTKEHDIPLNTPLEDDDGIIFRYKKRQQILLPQQRKNILTDNIYNYLKTKAGINSDYHTPEMKFYKFKTTEIDINDNI